MTLSIATSAGSADVAPAASSASFEVLLGLFVLLVAAKLGEEVVRRLGQPGVVGELLGGFIVGPYALGLVSPGQTAEVFAEVGVVILLFSVGLEVRLDDLLAVGRPAVATAIIGMILPIAAGLGLGAVLGGSTGSSAYVGLALAATSIGITSKVLGDYGVLDRRFSRVVLGAAVIDDVLALIAIGLVDGATSGDLSATTILVAIAAIGLVILGFVVARAARGLRREVFTWPLFADTPLVPAFFLMLGLALVAAFVGLAAIIGAFVAGLIVAETEAREETEREVRPLALIFVPYFFAVTGASVDLGALLDPEVFVLALVLTILGLLTKGLGGVIGAWGLGRWSSVTVGVGMMPRGEVGIVVASLGLASGLLEPDTYSAVLVAVVATTIIAPLLLNLTVPRAVAEADAADLAAIEGSV